MSPNFFFFFLFLILSLSTSLAKAALVKDPPVVLKYHNGPLLKGKVNVNILWYGKFTPTQRSIILDFILSFNSSSVDDVKPSVHSWWQTTDKYKYKGVRVRGPSTLLLGNQILDPQYSLGKSLTDTNLIALAASKLAGDGVTTVSVGDDLMINTVNVVLTAEDVSVTGFCSRCGTHNNSVRRRRRTAGATAADADARLVYAWVGNSETQCPGQCAWPFHQPIYGPQTAPLVAPNGDVGVDGMVINLATVLAGTVTNPFKSGYYQGPATAPLEAVTACPGIFGSGAYPGYAGEVTVDKTTGASYNARGVNGRKYLLPAMWDPTTSKCATLV